MPALPSTTRKVAGANDNAKRFHNPALGAEQDAAAYVHREWSREAIIAAMSGSSPTTSMQSRYKGDRNQ